MLTHSLKAYSSSRGLSPIKALHELWRIDRGKAPTTDSDLIGISCDFEEWRKTGDLPRYASRALEHERLRHTEAAARGSPQLHFGSFP